MAIYITGDCHGDFSRFKTFKPENEKEDNYVIIAGDCGLIFANKRNFIEWKNIQFLNRLHYKILFVDGNHCNFDRLNKFKESVWKGGRVHVISKNVLHLMRGQVFDLDGCSVFTFGGAASNDIPYGVLYKDDCLYKEKKEKMELLGHHYRVAHEDWWPEEMASYKEMEEGLTNLLRKSNNVDYIITHCAPSSLQTLIYGNKIMVDDQTEYLEKIKETVSYKRWFFGHYHKNHRYGAKDFLLYEDIVRVDVDDI